MSSGNSQRLLLPAMLACCATALALWASTALADPSGAGAAGTQPPLRVAERSEMMPQRGIPPAQPNEHPLMPVLRWASAGLAQMQANVHDYSATLVKRERVSGKLNEYEYLFLKIRQKPFSVYMYFLGPASLKGREVIYVAGQNNGNMWAHTTGVQDTLVGTLSLKPDGMIAMQGQRYPLTEIGLVNLTQRLIEVGQKDAQYGECDVKFFPGAKINNRLCTCIQVTHPVPRRNFLFHVARIFVDEELNVPVRYESYDWPKDRGAAPDLLEEYTYLNLKVNQGFSDADFDIHNSNYRFR
jgi:outer membrane lipoprotein-sorting protein